MDRSKTYIHFAVRSLTACMAVYVCQFCVYRYCVIFHMHISGFKPLHNVFHCLCVTLYVYILTTSFKFTFLKFFLVTAEARLLVGFNPQWGFPLAHCVGPQVPKFSSSCYHMYKTGV